MKKIIKKINRLKYVKYLKNPVTIISNDCCGGCIYNDIGMKFYSPTINLSMSGEDFLKFVNNVSSYANSELIQIRDENKQYPVGKIINENGDIIIDFVHYQSFEKAQIKWYERCKRINYDNIFILYHNNENDKNIIKEILKLEDKKIILGYESQKLDVNDSIYIFKSISSFIPAYILRTNKKTFRRFLEEFDYGVIFKKKKEGKL